MTAAPFLAITILLVPSPLFQNGRNEFPSIELALNETDGVVGSAGIVILAVAAVAA